MNPWHWLMHCFGWAGGHVQSMTLTASHYRVWWQCDTCGKVAGVTDIEWPDDESLGEVTLGRDKCR